MRFRLGAQKRVEQLDARLVFLSIPMGSSGPAGVQAPDKARSGMLC